MGLRVDAVDYWDVHNFSDEPRQWDHGTWHHAVMGVGLRTTSGPVSVMWTNTFFPYGVEVFYGPMTSFLWRDEGGPESWTVTDSAPWQARAGQPVSAVQTHWERLELGPSTRQDGSVAAPSRAIDLPTALRVDFAAGPVWFVAGIPQDDGTLFVPGDEIVVAFSTEAILSLGYPADSFTLT